MALAISRCDIGASTAMPDARSLNPRDNVQRDEEDGRRHEPYDLLLDLLG
jgi:hypothetical protein